MPQASPPRARGLVEPRNHRVWCPCFGAEREEPETIAGGGRLRAVAAYTRARVAGNHQGGAGREDRSRSRDRSSFRIRSTPARHFHSRPPLARAQGSGHISRARQGCEHRGRLVPFSPPAGGATTRSKTSARHRHAPRRCARFSRAARKFSTHWILSGNASSGIVTSRSGRCGSCASRSASARSCSGSRRTCCARCRSTSRAPARCSGQG